jgi:ERCC4-type nuclease
VSDLAASIKDGRYQEQSYRLDGTELHNHNIVYLIEGNMARAKFDKSALYSAMFSIQYFKGFSVMRSNTLEESAIILCNMLFKILKSDKPPYYTSAETNSTTSEEPINDYCSVVKRVKKDNIQKDNIGEIMLCQIPGVSDVTSRAIFAKFKTITGLILAIQQDEHCLDDIQTVMANGKPRKINKTSVQRIVEFLKD